MLVIAVLLPICWLYCGANGMCFLLLDLSSFLKMIVLGLVGLLLFLASSPTLPNISGISWTFNNITLCRRQIISPMKYTNWII